LPEWDQSVGGLTTILSLKKLSEFGPDKPLITLLNGDPALAAAMRVVRQTFESVGGLPDCVVDNGNAGCVASAAARLGDTVVP